MIVARLTAVLAVLLVVVACAPAAIPTFDRTGETVQINVVANDALYGATLSIVNASTDDERCVQLGDTDLGCDLGDLAVDSTTTIDVTSPGDLSCVVFAYLEPGNLATYRPFPCRTD